MITISTTSFNERDHTFKIAQMIFLTRFSPWLTSFNNVYISLISKLSNRNKHLMYNQNGRFVQHLQFGC